METASLFSKEYKDQTLGRKTDDEFMNCSECFTGCWGPNGKISLGFMKEPPCHKKPRPASPELLALMHKYYDEAVARNAGKPYTPRGVN